MTTYVVLVVTGQNEYVRRTAATTYCALHLVDDAFRDDNARAVVLLRDGVPILDYVRGADGEMVERDR